MTPRLRVETLLVGARRVFGPDVDEALVRELAAESGLHPSNVAHALREVLELSPADEELEAMIRRAPERDAVLVVLAANVFLAPFRAIAWALAQSERVIVRPSRRAPSFVRALMAAVPALGVEVVDLGDDPAADVARGLASLPPNSAVHAYGSRATVDAIGAAARRSGVAAELHGPGFGAIVASSDAVVAQAAAIARDVAEFDQGGCLSPRVALIVGDVDAAADALHVALTRVGEEVPRRTLDPAETAAIMQSRDAAIFAGRALEGSEHLVAVLPDARLAPAGRVLTMTRARDGEDALARLAALGPDLSIVGASDELLAACVAALPRVRVARLGRMQRPPLDGPVDLRPLGGEEP